MEPVKIPAGYLLPDGKTMADIVKLDLELLAAEEEGASTSESDGEPDGE